MTTQTPIDAINRPMNALRYSLARYLRFVRPWIDANCQSIAETIGRVAESHSRHVTRLGKLLVERQGHAESRTFPRAFGAFNDLSIEYLLLVIIEDERQIIGLFEATAIALECDAEAFNLVVEVLAHEKLHLQILERALSHRYAMRSDTPSQARHRASEWPAANGSLHQSTRPAGRGARELGPIRTYPQNRVSAVLQGGDSPC